MQSGWHLVFKSVLLVCAIGGFSAWAAPPQGFAAKPVFADEFRGDALDLSRWEYRGLGPRGLAIQTKDAVSVSNGHLVITTYSSRTTDGPEQVYSGMISTGEHFKMRYGYWEASVRCHYTSGMQPAFWLQSSTIGKQIVNPEQAGVELDIFEHVSGRPDPDTFDHALHWDGYAADHKSVARFFTQPGLSDGKFHTFGLAWTPESYSFYVDGKLTLQLGKGDAPISQAEESIILSTEIYRAVPTDGYGTRETSTALFEVDYVRVYPLLSQ